MNKNFHHYNKHLRRYAREHRNHSTKAEVRIWCELLRAKKMMGYPFLRQRPILNYIADFYCKNLKLVLEIDGWTHEDEDIKKKDAIRQKNIEEKGYKVLRFTDYEVFHHIDEVKKQMEEFIKEEENNSSPVPSSTNI